MKISALAFFVIASITASAQGNLEQDIVGQWSVVEVLRLNAPGADVARIENLKQAMKSMRFDFGADHHLSVDSNEPDYNVDDGYWVVQGGYVRVGKWEDQGKNLSLMRLAAQQRDGRWFFVVENTAELEVRKD